MSENNTKSHEEVGYVTPRFVYEEKTQEVQPQVEDKESNNKKAIPPKQTIQDKAIPPRPARDRVSQDWARIDDLFYRTIGHAETAFKTNLGINIIIVAIGITLISYSIAYSITKSLDLYSTAFGTLGVASFITTLFVGPQRNIGNNVADLTKIQMCYRTYAAQWEAINDYLYYHEANMDLRDLYEINNQLETLTCKSVEEKDKFVANKYGGSSESNQSK